MYKTQEHNSTVSGKVGYSVLLALAVLVLFLSCPLKRLLHSWQPEQIAETQSTPAKPSLVQGNQVAKNFACNIAEVATESVVFIGTQNVNLPSWLNLLAIDSNNKCFRFSISASDIISIDSAHALFPQLPFFLQHRRLLI
jgi:hypothetical protein